MVSSTSRRPSGQHHGNLRAEFEEAALDLIVEKGVHGLTMAEASRRAGVSAAAPFKHYSGRDALLAALAVRGYEAQARRFSAAVAQSADAAEQLAEFAASYVRFAVEERALFEATFGSGLDKRRYPDVEAAGKRVLDVLREPAHALRSAPASALDLIHAVAACAHGYAAFLSEGVFGEPSAQLLDTVAGHARASALKLSAPQSPRPRH